MQRAGSVILDTSVIVDYMRGDQRLVPEFAAAPAMYVPLVVLGELHFGMQRALWRDDALAQVREFLRITTVLLPDEITAEHYGQVKAESRTDRQTHPGKRYLDRRHGQATRSAGRNEGCSLRGGGPPENSGLVG